MSKVSWTLAALYNRNKIKFIQAMIQRLISSMRRRCLIFFAVNGDQSRI